MSKIGKFAILFIVVIFCIVCFYAGIAVGTNEQTEKMRKSAALEEITEEGYIISFMDGKISDYYLLD